MNKKLISNFESGRIKMKRSPLIFLILIIFYSSNYPQETLTLNDAIKIAINKNTSIIKAQNNLETQTAAIKNAYGDLLPNLNISGSWNWQKVTDKGGETQIDFFGKETTLPPSDVDTRNFSVSAGGSVTLFDGLSNIANIEQSKNNYSAAKLDLDKLRQDVILQTVNLYFAIISYDSLLKYQEEDLKYNQELLNKINEMQKLKMVTLADVYSQEAQTANSEFTLLQTKNNYEKAKISLLNYLSLNINEEYLFDLPNKNEFDSDLASQDFSQLLNIALSNRKDYLSQKFKLESAMNQLTIARSNLYPSLTGNYRFSSNATSLNAFLGRKTYGVGISLNIPVFSNWNTDYAIQSAQVNLENDNEELNALERQIASDVKNALLDFQTSKLQLEVSKKALLSAEESLDIKRESYDVGASTYIDFQLTYDNYLQTKNNSIQAQYNNYVKQYALLNAIGNLREK
jgi:outer membrane protein